MKFSCPHCGQSLEGDPEWAGLAIGCPTCGRNLVVSPPRPAPTAPWVASKPAPRSGGRAVKFLLALLLGAGAAFGYLCYRHDETPQQAWQRILANFMQPAPLAQAAPAPRPPPLGAPAATVFPFVAVAPDSAPKTAATPTPPPDPVTWILEHKEHWPKEVTLASPVEFPVALDGKVFGSAKIPAGELVNVVRIDAVNVTGNFNGGEASVPIGQTDLRQRATAAMATPEEQPAPAPGVVIPANASPARTTTLGPRTFVHPGIPLTREDLDEIKRNLGREPWKSAFEALKRDPLSQLGRKMNGPFDTVCRTPDINLTPWKRDMDAFYKLALLWYLTGNEAYAQKGHDLLMAYVKGQKSFGGVEMYLSLGDYADTVVGAADILRGTWPGWTPEDTDLSKAYFRNIYAAAWPTNPLRSANQGALQLINYVCVSVFLDDSDMFNECVRLFLSDPETALTDTLPNGELGDTGRDQGHAGGELVRTLLAAEIFWKQGVDVYSARDNRLLAMGEFYARFNLYYPTPFMPFGTKYGLYATIGPKPGTVGLEPLSMIQKAYTIRMGLSAPYSTQAIDADPPDARSFLYYKIADHSKALPPPPMPAPAPTEPLTDGLEDAEIGDASPGGSGAFAGGTWTIRGGGTAAMLNPPWGKWAWRGDDSCHFAYRKVTGDVTLIARVTSIEAVQNFTMAGLMIRDSLQPQAARMAVWSTPNAREKGPSVETDLRGFSHSSHESSFQLHENAAIPYWLKLERVGDRITCWHSPEGASWTPIEDGLFPGMGKTAYLGLFVCSTVNGKGATATFDTVRMTGGGGVEHVKKPAAPFAIYGGPGDGQVPLRWLESFGATSYNVKRSRAKGGPYETVATIKGTSFVDKSVMNGKTYYYVVTAMNAAGASPNSLEDSVTPRGP